MTKIPEEIQKLIKQLAESELPEEKRAAKLIEKLYE